MKTDTELKNFSNYIIHDLRMLQRTVEILATQPTDNTYIRNALMESALIHARCLIDFLYYPKHRESDVIIDDYLENDKQLSLEETELIREYRKRIGKEIAHLTYNRGTYGKWKLSTIANELSERMREFYVLCPKEKLHNNVIKFFSKTDNNI